MRSNRLSYTPSFRKELYRISEGRANRPPRSEGAGTPTCGAAAPSILLPPRSVRDRCGAGPIGGPTPNVSFGFGECDVDTADQVGNQVVQHRTDRGQGREQH